MKKRDIFLLAALVVVALVIFLVARPKSTVISTTTQETLLPLSTVTHPIATDAPTEKKADAAEGTDTPSASADEIASTPSPSALPSDTPTAAAAPRAVTTTGTPEQTPKASAVPTPVTTQTAEATAASTPESTEKAEAPVSASPDAEASAGPTAMPTLAPATAYMLVTVQGMTYAPYPITQEDRITLRQSDGAENIISISPGSMHMESSTCDNQDCVQQGEVTLENMKTRILWSYIVCLPNGVELQLLTPEEAQEIWESFYALQS